MSHARLLQVFYSSQALMPGCAALIVLYCIKCLCRLKRPLVTTFHRLGCGHVFNCYSVFPIFVALSAYLLFNVVPPVCVR